MNHHCAICEQFKTQNHCSSCDTRFSDVFMIHRRHIIYDIIDKEIHVLCTRCYVEYLNKSLDYK